MGWPRPLSEPDFSSVNGIKCPPEGLLRVLFKGPGTVRAHLGAQQTSVECRDKCSPSLALRWSWPATYKMCDHGNVTLPSWASASCSVRWDLPRFSLQVQHRRSRRDGPFSRALAPRCSVLAGRGTLRQEGPLQRHLLLGPLPWPLPTNTAPCLAQLSHVNAGRSALLTGSPAPADPTTALTSHSADLMPCISSTSSGAGLISRAPPPGR